jgi:ABC-2 type transport system ATP-binding protein
MNGLPGESVVQVRGLRVRYGRVEALHGIDFSVGRGEVVGLIGPDGAGKSSTLRVVAGLARACAGTATVLGLPSFAERRRLHHRLGWLAQRFALYGDLSVDENVEFFGRLYGLADWRGRRDELLARVDLAKFRDRLADRLSGGMKQKLALACSLMHAPEILLLDEPTTGVDPVTRRELWRLLATLVAEGMTLVVATPYLDEAERCSRVVLLHEGEILADAPPRELAARLPGVVLEIAGTPRLLAGETLRGAPGVVDVQSFGDRFHVRLEGVLGPERALAERLAAAGVEVEEIRPIPAGLEDTFLHLTRSRAGAKEKAA